KRVEMLFAHLKRILRLGRLRLRGPRGAQFEFIMAAIAQNLRRLAKLAIGPPPPVISAAVAEGSGWRWECLRGPSLQTAEVRTPIREAPIGGLLQQICQKRRNAVQQGLSIQSLRRRARQLPTLVSLRRGLPAAIAMDDRHERGRSPLYPKPASPH